MVPKENINVIEQMNNILRFDVEISDEPKKDMPATSNTAQDSIKYDIPNSKSEVCYMNTSEEDIDIDSKDADLTLPQTLQSVQKEAQKYHLTNKHNHLDLKRSVSSHASCINLMNRNGSSYNTSVADESYSLNSKDKKGSPKSKVCVKNEIIDTWQHQQCQPEHVAIDEQALSDSEIINLDEVMIMMMMNLLLKTVIHLTSSSNPSSNQKYCPTTTMNLGLSQVVLAIIPHHPAVVIIVLVVNHQLLLAIVIVVVVTMILIIESLICNKLIHANHFYSI